MRYLLFLFVFISSITLAQNGINYQGAATDSDGAKLADQNISLRTSVLQGGVDGTTSYSETHNTTTDQFGLFNVVIGQGEVVSGAFDSISWGADAHFLKVELDATGGSDYSLVSTTQMMSVPYAKYAENTGLDSAMVANMINQALENNINGIGIGDYYQGGIIGYIFEEGDSEYIPGEIHGYIVNINEYYGPWGCTDLYLGANSEYGIENTQLIAENGCPLVPNTSGNCNNVPAAKYWYDLSENGYDDWFMPSTYEANYLQKTINSMGNNVFQSTFLLSREVLFTDCNYCIPDDVARYWCQCNSYVQNTDFYYKNSCTNSIGIRIF